MYTVLYQWKIHQNKQDDFISSWEVVTDHYLTNHGSLGSRLHKISDNSFIAYSQWPSKQARDIAFNLNDAPQQAIDTMEQSIITTHSPVETAIISDKLKRVPTTESTA